ncbi:MAG: hypothetical protein RL708_2291 [Bacteroidota bacterium]|jgi:hypothetical protein
MVLIRPIPIDLILMKRFLLSILCLFIFEINSFSQGIGNGSDGSPNISGIVNSYSSIINISSNSCQSILTVNTNSGFSVGNLVMIIQMQGAAIDTTNTSNYGIIQNDSSSGLFEYSKIISVLGNVITLSSILTNSYQINGKVQLIKVPQYINPTIVGTLTCMPWNGNTGGVLAIDAIGKINFSDSIDVTGKGFRGGQIITAATNPAHVFNYYSSYNPSMFAAKGEGISGNGLSPFIYGKGAPANGGGGGNSVNAGGGGGGSFGCGGDGGHAFNTPIYGTTPNLAAGFGGKTLNYSILRACLGGGGGAAHENDNHAYDGGNGGGIVLITSNSIVGAANKINSNGMTALNSTNDGGSGGGGGSILISCLNYTTPIYVNLKGGDGASTTDVSGYQHGGGGGGGGGLIWVSQTTKPTNMFINQNGGLGGLASGANSGSTNGCSGGTLFKLNLSFIASVNINSLTTLSICQNDTAILQLNSQAHHITWSPSTNLSCTNCISPKAYPTSTTTYIVTDSVNHCFNRDTFIVKVNLKTFSNLNDSLCQGNIFTAPSGKQYSTVGIYYDTIANHNSCDSIITIQLSACTNTFSHTSFQFIDSFCTNYPISITNTSLNNVTNCWSFDSLNINGVKSSVNLGVLNSALNSTTAGTLIEDGGNYYLFITNSFTTDLIRCDLGTNPLNTIPLSTTIISNVLPGGHNEAVQFFKESGNWYAIVDGGNSVSAFMSRLNFGASITNTSPTVIPLVVPVLGNWPHQLEIFKNGTNYIGFVVCRTNGDVQRVDFGTSITNTPTITTVYSSFNPSVGFAMEQENGNWYMMISTNNVPGDLRLLNFGTNILNNAPTVTNLGNVGGMLNAPRAIKLF